MVDVEPRGTERYTRTTGGKGSDSVSINEAPLNKDGIIKHLDKVCIAIFQINL